MNSVSCVLKQLIAYTVSVAHIYLDLLFCEAAAIMSASMQRIERGSSSLIRAYL